MKKYLSPPLSAKPYYDTICAVDRSIGIAGASLCLVGKDKERKPTMFMLKQNKSLKLSDNWQHRSFCLNSIECRQSYSEDSDVAGSRT